MTTPRKEVSLFKLVSNPVTPLATIQEYINKNRESVFQIDLVHGLPIRHAARWGSLSTVQYLWEIMSNDSRFDAKELLSSHKLLDSVLKAPIVAGKMQREYIATLHLEYLPESETLPANIVLGNHDKVEELLIKDPDKKSSSGKTPFNYALLGCQPRIMAFLCKRYTNENSAEFLHILRNFTDTENYEDSTKEHDQQFAHCLSHLIELMGRFSKNSFNQLLINAYRLAYYRFVETADKVRLITEVITESLKLSRELKVNSKQLTRCFKDLYFVLEDILGESAPAAELMIEEIEFLIDDTFKKRHLPLDLFLNLDQEIKSGKQTPSSAVLLIKAEYYLLKQEEEPVKYLQDALDNISAIPRFTSPQIAMVFWKLGIALAPEKIDLVSKLFSYTEKHKPIAKAESKDEKQCVSDPIESPTKNILELVVESFATSTELFINCFHKLVTQEQWENIYLILQHASKTGRAHLFQPNMLIEKIPLILRAAKAKAFSVVSLLVQYVEDSELSAAKLIAGHPDSSPHYTNCTVTYFVGLSDDLNLFKRLVNLNVPLYYPEFTENTTPFLKALLLNAEDYSSHSYQSQCYEIFQEAIEKFPEEITQDRDEVIKLTNSSGLSYFATHLRNQQQQLECDLNIFLNNSTLKAVLSGQQIINRTVIRQEDMQEIKLMELLLHKIKTLETLIHPKDGMCPVSPKFYNKFMVWCAECKISRDSYKKESALIPAIPVNSPRSLVVINQFIGTVTNIFNRQRSSRHVEPGCTLVFLKKKAPAKLKAPGDEKTAEPLTTLAKHSVLTNLRP